MDKTRDCKCRDGYRVSGKNTADGRLSLWYFPTQEDADRFAKHLVEDTSQDEVDVLLYVGSWRKAKPPLEFIPAKPLQNEEQQNDG